MHFSIYRCDTRSQERWEFCRQGYRGERFPSPIIVEYRSNRALSCHNHYQFFSTVSRRSRDKSQRHVHGLLAYYCCCVCYSGHHITTILWREWSVICALLSYGRGGRSETSAECEARLAKTNKLLYVLLHVCVNVRKAACVCTRSPLQKAPPTMARDFKYTAGCKRVNM